jgi:GT2 family glycosyltransferase
MVSCVICTVGRADSIGRAVASVLAQEYRQIELIVVDQTADDSTRDACAPFNRDPRFRYVHTDRTGLSHAYNLGIAASAAEIIAFTDDDCVAPPDWASSIVDVFDAHADVDMLYGQTLAPVGHVDGATIIPTLAFKRPRRIERATGIEIIGMGANFALRRSLIAEVGLFDEALGGGGPLRSSQDFDFQYRVYKAGRVVRLSPEVTVDHYGARQTGDQWDKTLKAYGIGDGAFYWKHVRCGDLTALRLLVQRMGKLLIREALNPIRRKPNNRVYLRSCLSGIRASMRFPVDRQQRMYVLGERTPR